MLSYGPWKFEEFKSLFESDALDQLSRGEACVLLAVAVSFLYIWTVLAETCHQWLAVLRIDSEFAAHMAVLSVAESLLHLSMEWTVEFADHAVPYHFALGNLVEVLLDVCCESIVKDGLEILYKIVSYDHSDILRKKSSLLGSDCFGLR